MPRRRFASTRTLMLQQRASLNRKAVAEALASGATLTISNVTDIEAGTVHVATARALVITGRASRVPDPDRPGWTLDQIAAKEMR